MKVFSHEIKSGLSDLITKNNSISSISVPIICTQAIEQIRLEQLISKSSTELTSLDLHITEAILASVGWNKNDDIFTPTDLWLARHTPINKPFNFMHNPAKVIGHIVGVYAKDYNNLLIADDIQIDNLPPLFELVTTAVIYKNLNTELEESTAELINEIEEGKWFVSMECLFNHFDYALTSGSEHVIVERNEETSFLTKHLRIYGGHGEYDGKKIGRVLRNMVFSGKGLVNNPANPRSVILRKEDMTPFQPTKATVVVFNHKENLMSDKTYTQTEFDAVATELKEVKAALAQAAESAKVELQNKLTEATATIQAKEEIISAKESQIDNLTKELDETKSELAKLQEEISIAKLEAIKSARLNALLANEVEESKAKELVDKFVTVSDELFSDVVEAYAAKKGTKSKDEEKDSSCAKKGKMSDDEEEEDDMEDSSCSVQDEETTTVAEEVVENTNVEEAEVVNASAVETLRAAASAWISQNLKFTKKN